MKLIYCKERGVRENQDGVQEVSIIKGKVYLRIEVDHYEYLCKIEDIIFLSCLQEEECDTVKEVLP